MTPLESPPPTAAVIDAAPRNPARWLYYRSWAALAFIAGLLVLHQVWLQPALARLTSDAPVINVSGRQRMLSQRLTKAALALEHATTDADRMARREELKATVVEWTRAQRGLQQGNAELHLPGNNTAPVQQVFRELEPHFRAIVAAADILLAADAAHTATARSDALMAILAHEPQFVTRMHAIVGLYEAEARGRIQRLQTFGVAIIGAILGLLLLVQWIVVRPAVQFVGREFEQSEEQYRRLVESMNDGVLTLDPQGRVVFANRRLGQILGHAVADLVGKPVSLFVADPDRRRFDMLQQSPSGPMEIALQHRDGRTIETMISPRPLLDMQGSPQGVLLVITDMTARKQAEARGRELLDQLAHADRLKSMGEMTASLAHEINQPLGAIANFAEGCLAQLADPSCGPAELHQPLARILSAALRGGEIIRRTRSFAQLRPHSIADVCINGLIREVEELLLPEARRHGVLMNFQLAPDLPSVPADAIQIQQVLTNLIQNAFHALEETPAYRRRLTVQTSVPDTSECPGHFPSELEISVIDNGPGFSAADAERLFEPFVTTRAEGTGMGLAIARGIVEAHGGRIWAEPARDRGAMFTFALPLEAPELEKVSRTLPSFRDTALIRDTLELAHG